jgi:hypothetical protein
MDWLKGTSTGKIMGLSASIFPLNQSTHDFLAEI